MEDSRFLKIIRPIEKEEKEPLLDPLRRFKGLVLNLTENAIVCLNRLLQFELEKEKPSGDIVEDYYLIQHYLCFIKKICQ
jgi:hypothetical protein